jgi:hypothetical protein
MKKLSAISILILAITIIAFSGCKNKDQKQNLAKIDSILSKIDSVYVVFDRLQFERLKVSFEAYSANADYLKENINEIRTDENWPLLCAYTDVRKPIKSGFQNYYIIKNEIDTCEKQLLNLKSDVSSGIIADKDFETYFATESQFSKNAVNKVITKLIFSEKYLVKFDSLNPLINKLIEDNKNKPLKKNDKKAKK